MTRPISNHRGVTLIEMLVVAAISMIMIAAMAQIFALLGENVNKGRAVIELSGQLRNVTHRLRQDLDGLTISTLPWAVPGSGGGYFEYVEGPGRDNTQAATMWGDRDDVLMFTARSKGKPFVGRYTGAASGMLESELAEIIWWTESNDDNGNGQIDPEEVLLYRRVLLIRPDVSVSGIPSTFIPSNDISVRTENGQLKANSLDDLTLRQNRFAHNATVFPHAVNTGATEFSPLAGNDLGNDVVLANIVAFDVRVYDPQAPLATGTSLALAPGDSGYTTPAAGAEIGRGAFVDLNYAGSNAISFYSGPPNTKSQLSTPTYDTWPFFYERDGVNQDGDALADEGTNGFDDGGNPAPDDPSEYETMPPYPHPLTGFKFPGLRGIQVRIRIVETDTRQVRQATVVSDFTPE